MIGLPNATKPGFPGGIGGIVIGLPNATRPGLPGGIGGMVIGLKNAVTPGLPGGIGGIVMGLASAQVATAAKAALNTMPRIFNVLEFMELHSLLGEKPMPRKSNPKVSVPLLQK